MFLLIFIFLSFILSIWFLSGPIILFYGKNLAINIDYEIPLKPKKKENVDYRAISELLLNYFPNLKTVPHKKKKKNSVFLRLPSNVKILGVINGAYQAVILKIGNKEIFLIKGDKKHNSYKGWSLLNITEKFIYLQHYNTLYKIRYEELFPQKNISKKTSKEKSGGYLVVSRKIIEQLTKNPGQLFMQIDIMPYVVNGITKGFRIKWIDRRSIFYKLGFRKGDVILSVNGYGFRTTEDAFRLIQVLRNEPNLRVEVLRNGIIKIFDIKIE